jgi:hypothetical protein
MNRKLSEVAHKKAHPRKRDSGARLWIISLHETAGTEVESYGESKPSFLLKLTIKETKIKRNFKKYRQTAENMIE